MHAPHRWWNQFALQTMFNAACSSTIANKVEDHNQVTAAMYLTLWQPMFKLWMLKRTGVHIGYFRNSVCKYANVHIHVSRFDCSYIITKAMQHLFNIRTQWTYLYAGHASCTDCTIILSFLKGSSSTAATGLECAKSPLLWKFHPMPVFLFGSWLTDWTSPYFDIFSPPLPQLVVMAEFLCRFMVMLDVAWLVFDFRFAVIICYIIICIFIIFTRHLVIQKIEERRALEKTWKLSS